MKIAEIGTKRRPSGSPKPIIRQTLHRTHQSARNRRVLAGVQMRSKQRAQVDAHSDLERCEDQTEHPLQAGLDHARIARLYLASRHRDDLTLYLDLVIYEIEEEIGRPPPFQ